MPKFHLMLAATTLLLAAPVVAIADDMPRMTMGMHATSAADSAFRESMQKMMNDMDVETTGNTDKDFVVMMMPHHQGAIDMARAEIKYGKDPMLLKMAADIVTAQEKEIAEMRDWLAKNGN